LEAIIEELRAAAEIEHVVEHTLQQAVEGWLAERKGSGWPSRASATMVDRYWQDV
jgi:hypothetical protein